jgi:hypothetical protein
MDENGPFIDDFPSYKPLVNEGFSIYIYTGNNHVSGIIIPFD